jgi:hypothetical protein
VGLTTPPRNSLLLRNLQSLWGGHERGQDTHGVVAPVKKTIPQDTVLPEGLVSYSALPGRYLGSALISSRSLLSQAS